MHTTENTMKKYIIAVFSLVTLIVACAQSVLAKSDLSMIASRDALRSYAIEQVSQAWGGVWSRSIIESPQTAFQFAINDRPVDISRFSEEIARRVFDFRVANPRDGVYFNVTYANRESDALFQGGSFAKFKLEKKGWSFPRSLGVELWLNYEIPLTVSNVYFARILIENEQGETVYEVYPRIDSKTGKIYFPSQLAGANGFLIVNRSEGEGPSVEEVFNLRTGLPVVPTKAQTILNVSIRDVIERVVSQKDPKLTIQVPSWNGFGESPTVQLNVVTPEDHGNDNLVKVLFLVQTTEGELAEVAVIRQITEGEIVWYHVPLEQKGNPTDILMSPGLYHVIFTWKTFRPYPPSIPDKGDSGKG